MKIYINQQKGGFHMPVMDEFREERESIKQGTFKQKYQYFKDYYRAPVIVALVVAIIIGNLIYTFVTHKDSAFYAVMLNCTPLEDKEALTEEYAQYADIDLEEYTVDFDTGVFYNLSSPNSDNYNTIQKIVTYVGAGAVDVMLGGGDDFTYFAYSNMFMDLRTVLSEEQLQKYQSNLFYIDASLIDPDSMEQVDPGDYADPKAPEDMGNPIPVAIYVESGSKLNNAYDFGNANDGIALGIFVSTPHTDNAVAFIDYLLRD